MAEQSSNTHEEYIFIGVVKGGIVAGMGIIGSDAYTLESEPAEVVVNSALRMDVGYTSRVIRRPNGQSINSYPVMCARRLDICAEGEPHGVISVSNMDFARHALRRLDYSYTIKTVAETAVKYSFDNRLYGFPSLIGMVTSLDSAIGSYHTRGVSAQVTVPTFFHAGILLKTKESKVEQLTIHSWDMESLEKILLETLGNPKVLNGAWTYIAANPAERQGSQDPAVSDYKKPQTRLITLQ